MTPMQQSRLDKAKLIIDRPADFKVCEACGGCHLGRMQLQKDAYYLQYLMNSFAKNGRVDSEDMPRIF